MVLGVYGAGGEGREVKETAEAAAQWNEVVLIDDTQEAGLFCGCRRMPFGEFCKAFPAAEAEVVIALGEPRDRALLYDRVRTAGYSLANVIHPLAFVSPTARLGIGITVKMGVCISAGAVIEDNVGLGIQSVISHDALIGQSSQISPHAAVSGHAGIGRGTFVGAGACIREKVKVGADCIIGMGAVVTGNIPGGSVAYGNPARVMRENLRGRVFR